MNAVVIVVFLPILAGILLGLNLLLAPKRFESEKLTSYECGFLPLTGQTRAPFTIQFYLVGILFLIFDLEIAVIFPLAVSLYSVTLYGYGIGLLFMIVLTIGFVYERSKGALYFTDHRSDF